MGELLNSMRIDDSLVIRHLKAVSDQDALDKMANMLLSKGIVKESYIPAVKEREIVYSTGLACEDMGVAIPHTDAEHVNIQAMGVGILDEPVQFAQMGTPEIKVDVKIIFMLAIKEPHKQMEFLQALMGIFAEAGKLNRLLETKDEQEIVSVLREYFENGNN